MLFGGQSDTPFPIPPNSSDMGGHFFRIECLVSAINKPRAWRPSPHSVLEEDDGGPGPWRRDLKAHLLTLCVCVCYILNLIFYFS